MLGPIAPGEILKEEFLEPMGISAYRLAKTVNIPQSRISAIINGTRRITADTAMRFARAFGTTPQFWLNLQMRYDLDMILQGGRDYEQIEPLRAEA